MLGFLALLLTGAAPPAARAAPTYDRPPISYADYPEDALRANRQGLVQVRLAIDAAGKVAGCTVVQSSGTPSLDAATCDILQSRAAFTPARDAAGRPVPDVYLQKIAWRIAGPVREPALDAAAQAWVNCLLTEAGSQARGHDPAESVADRAFAACTQGERGMLTAIAATVPKGATPVSEVPRELRQGIRETVLKRIAQLRAAEAGSSP